MDYNHVRFYEPALTPIRHLDGITYWVIEDPADIEDFVGSVLRREWEADLRYEGKDPAKDECLASLLGRRWELKVLNTLDVKPDSDYVNSERLRQRRAELRRSLEVYGSVIWPIVVRAEGYLLADGYCRYATLRDMGVGRLYAYVGSTRR
jgi:hypothetical protein